MTNTFFVVILSLFAEAASLSHPHRQAEITSSNTSKMLILSSSLRAILCGICFFNIVPLAPCVGGPLVLYGSQTGAAEDVAYHIAEGIRYILPIFAIAVPFNMQGSVRPRPISLC